MKSRPFIPGRVREVIRSHAKGTDLFHADVLVPVPLSVQRQKERGFNQAGTMASVISGYTNTPVDEFSLRRKVHTPMHRGGMDQKAREITVKKAFKVVRPKFIEGKRVLLIDDVLTSGSTASACARVLLDAGASQVNVFTLARAVLR